MDLPFSTGPVLEEKCRVFQTKCYGQWNVSLNLLPEELILIIMSHFEAEELSLTIAQVCKR